MAARVRGDGGEAGSGTQLRKQHSTSYVRSLPTGATLSLQLIPLLHGVLASRQAAWSGLLCMQGPRKCRGGAWLGRA